MDNNLFNDFNMNEPFVKLVCSAGTLITVIIIGLSKEGKPLHEIRKDFNQFLDNK